MKLEDVHLLAVPRKGEKGESLPSTLDTLMNAKVSPDPRTAYWLTRILQKLISEVTALNKAKDKLIDGYLIDGPLPKDAKEGTKPPRILDQSKSEEINKKWEAMLQQEATIEVNSKIKLSWLAGAELTNGDFILLDKFIEPDLGPGRG